MGFKQQIKRNKNVIFSLAAIVFLWLMWLIAYYSVRNDYVVPSIGETFRQMGKLLGEKAFWRAFAGTFLRTLYAFLFSLVAGVAFAVLARLFAPLRAFLSPIITVLRTVPTMAIVLLLLLWTTPVVAPVIVSVLVLFPAMYAAVLASLDEVEAEYGEFVRAFQVKKSRRVFQVYLPLSAPPVILQAGGIFSMGLKITVSGEVLSSTYKSLGGMMQEAKMFVEMPRLLALTVLVVLLGLVLELACRLAYLPVARWRK